MKVMAMTHKEKITMQGQRTGGIGFTYLDAVIAKKWLVVEIARGDVRFLNSSW